MTSNNIIKQLKSLSSSQRAKVNGRFFKTGPGEYAEGDIFWGLTVPQVRQVVKANSEIALNEILQLLKHSVHEVRLCGILLLVARFPKDQDNCYKYYLLNTQYINNWDLVDSSAEYILGPYLQFRSKKILKELARSNSIWERRIAMLATFHYIKQGSPTEALEIAKILLNDSQDLIQKAVGWMLREIGKRCSVIVEEEFLRSYAAIMPRTTLRYAIEHFSPTKRLYYLKLKNQI